MVWYGMVWYGMVVLGICETEDRMQWHIPSQRTIDRSLDVVCSMGRQV